MRFQLEYLKSWQIEWLLLEGQTSGNNACLFCIPSENMENKKQKCELALRWFFDIENTDIRIKMSNHLNLFDSYLWEFNSMTASDYEQVALCEIDLTIQKFVLFPRRPLFQWQHHVNLLLAGFKLGKSNVEFDYSGFPWIDAKSKHLISE